MLYLGKCIQPLRYMSYRAATPGYKVCSLFPIVCAASRRICMFRLHNRRSRGTLLCIHVLILLGLSELRVSNFNEFSLRKRCFELGNFVRYGHVFRYRMKYARWLPKIYFVTATTRWGETTRFLVGSRAWLFHFRVLLAHNMEQKAGFVLCGPLQLEKGNV